MGGAMGAPKSQEIFNFVGLQKMLNNAVMGDVTTFDCTHSSICSLMVDDQNYKCNRML